MEPLSVEWERPLAPLTTLQVGGPARCLVTARTLDAVPAALRLCRAQGAPWVLGGGSNLVVSDRGVEAPALRLTADAVQVTEEGDRVRIRAEGGASWDRVVALAVSSGWQGIECLSGIPGTIGAAPVQNIGAYGQEVGEVVEEVEGVWLADGRPFRLSRSACGFGYRTSRFKAPGGDSLITAVTLALRRSGEGCRTYRDIAERLPTAASPAEVRATVLAVRRGKAMLVEPELGDDARSVGSFFVNPVVPCAVADALALRYPDLPRYPASEPTMTKLPAAWLIERADVARGFRQGAAAVSSRHTLALTVLPGGTAADLLALASTIRARVEARFGVRLHAEPVLVGFGPQGGLA